ncbi:adenylate/guanylate cyclase domain-containing protein [Ruegeria lacuscaerulensis]|uniref:adenylate/guanylate cyclase domain-containing protein n=1 Tax=Ruegeria lacuscaerulensis TaxID=55218 RepID=UPI00147A3F36|nr:adenylate/guanylate cyclase domain-containing protein [Ruegeria lacuscaerulensis]
MKRRLTTVLAADVVGYSALMDQDRQGTLAALRSFREDTLKSLLGAHKGRLIKSMGDGWIAEFPSTSDAADCAIAVQSAPKADTIRLRIGIHTGEVISDGDDIFGDGINIAARLEALAEPDQILISDTSHNSLDRGDAAQFDGGEQTELKNITRRIGVWCWPKGTSANLSTSADTRPGIAVLPFDNMSGDPEQEFFADGMTEDIITELSRFRWLMVVARNSSFIFKGKSTDIREVGRSLGVRYVLEGSVRRAGQRVRITGQLIDAENGSHLWADRFDGVLYDIFDLQDKVTQEVVTAIEPSLRHAETTRSRAKPTESLEAYELYLQALSHFHLLTDEDNREAIRLTTLALERDADYAAAAGLLAWLHIQRLVQGLEPVGKGPKAAVAAAERVLMSDRADGIAMAYAAHSISMLARDLPRARSAFKQALAENPNAASVHMLASINLCMLNRPDEALDHATQSVELSPKDPMRHAAHIARCSALFQLARYEEAAAAAREALAVRSGFVMSHLMLIAALGQLPDTAAAKSAVNDLNALRPDITASTEQAKLPVFSMTNASENWRAGWRNAGLPD